MKNRVVCDRRLAWVLGIVFCATGCMRESPPPRTTTTAVPHESALDYVEIPAAETSADELADASKGDSQAENPATSPVTPVGVRTEGPAAEVIQLARSGVDQEVILAYVGSTAAPFDLKVAEIICLHDLGVSKTVLNAMLQHDQRVKASTTTAPASVASESDRPGASVPSAGSTSAVGGATTAVWNIAPPAAPPAPGSIPDPIDPALMDAVSATPDLTDSTFYEALVPYGSWVEVADFGRVWQPCVGVLNTTWRPYLDGGHWLYSDCGWYWVSDYSWGWAPFHYGRWYRNPRLGWCWVPGKMWAPSWVCWRYTAGYCGWAPLPPGAQYEPVAGLIFRGRPVGVNFAFGLGADAFAFVPWGYFHEHSLRDHKVGADWADRIFRQSTPATRFVGGGSSLSNLGISREHVADVTHIAIEPVALSEAGGAPAKGARFERLSADGRTLIASRQPSAEILLSSASTQSEGVDEEPDSSRRTPGAPRFASARASSVQLAEPAGGEQDFDPRTGVRSLHPWRNRGDSRPASTPSELSGQRGQPLPSSPAEHRPVYTPPERRVESAPPPEHRPEPAPAPPPSSGSSFPRSEPEGR